MYIFLAFLIGFAVVFSTVLNGKLAERIGVINGASVNYLIGTGTSFLLSIWMIARMPSLEIVKTVPAYYYAGGFIGVGVIFLLNQVVPKIPSVYFVVLPLAGQLLSSALIDFFYLRILSTGKVIGGILVLTGLLINTYFDYKHGEQGKEESISNE